MNKFKAIIDGASRGNPGHAAIGVLIFDDRDEMIQKFHRYIGIVSNNIAEYHAFIACLEEIVAIISASKSNYASRPGGINITIHSDSELLVKQFNGEYRIKNPTLKELAKRIRNLIEKEGLKVDLIHVRRSETKEADRLANQALNLKEI